LAVLAVSVVLAVSAVSVVSVVLAVLAVSFVLAVLAFLAVLAVLAVSAVSGVSGVSVCGRLPQDERKVGRRLHLGRRTRHHRLESAQGADAASGRGAFGVRPTSG